MRIMWKSTFIFKYEIRKISLPISINRWTFAIDFNDRILWTPTKENAISEKRILIFLLGDLFYLKTVLIIIFWISLIKIS